MFKDCNLLKHLLGEVSLYLVLQAKLMFVIFSSFVCCFIGIQCDYRVLLGTVYRGIEHGFACDFGYEEEGSKSGFSGRSIKVLGRS